MHECVSVFVQNKIEQEQANKSAQSSGVCPRTLESVVDLEQLRSFIKLEQTIEKM